MILLKKKKMYAHMPITTRFCQVSQHDSGKLWQLIFHRSWLFSLLKYSVGHCRPTFLNPFVCSLYNSYFAAWCSLTVKIHWGHSAWDLQVLSGYSSFLSQSKDKQVNFTGDSQLATSVTVNVSQCYPCNRLVACPGSPAWTGHRLLPYD